jgi:uncharacterized damage-inducible protein DinB
MQYAHTAIPDGDVPRTTVLWAQHAIDTYASETNKVLTTWAAIEDTDLAFRPHPKSSSVEEILKHQLLSERRFFGEFLGSPEPAPEKTLPSESIVEQYCARMLDLARPRLAFLAARNEAWWLGETRFFDVQRQRVWIFWRRVLHTAHHRTQLTVYIRLLGKAVPPTYGPTADVSWQGADPTTTVDAAGRK